MFRKISPILLALSVLLVACGPQGTPTLAPAEVEGTAVSSAWTMVAMTQLAIPSATPLPPTETPSPTPLPTFTPLSSPTIDLALVVPPTATQAAGGEGNCLKPLDIGAAGPQSNVRFVNLTGGSVNLSLNLLTENAHGECGYIGVTIAKNDKVVVSLPKGNYWAYAWITYAEGKSGNASGFVNNRPGDNHQFTANINKEVINIP